MARALELDGKDWSTWEQSRTVQELQLAHLQLQLKAELGTETSKEARRTAASKVVSTLMKQTSSP